MWLIFAYVVYEVRQAKKQRESEPEWPLIITANTATKKEGKNFGKRQSGNWQ